MTTQVRHQDPVARLPLHLEADYGAVELARLSGLSYRQIDYYARTGLLSPSLRVARGSGTRRRYSQSDVARARLVAALRGHGASTEVMACVLAQLPADPADWSPFLFVSRDGEVRSLHPEGAVWWGISTARLLAEPIETPALASVAV